MPQRYSPSPTAAALSHRPGTFAPMYTTQVTHRVHAPRAAVYRALLDPEA
ncbi:polyketide cyclase, partial [Streptomyces sp. NRRL F-6602]